MPPDASRARGVWSEPDILVEAIRGRKAIHLGTLPDWAVGVHGSDNASVPDAWET
jgi:hypothetical protein